jgi:glycosyltransferase involved in cell wall biosynthesis
MKRPKISICTTNYNCAHAVKKHLDSVYSQLDEDMFEYIVVDNLSGDDSLKIMKEYAKDHPNMTVLSEKCSMGRGRQISFEHSSGEFIMVIDTDTLYFPIFKDFVDIYLKEYSDYALQAILCGIFPRNIWEEIGGRRDLNILEDVDMWVRIWRLGKIKFYPVLMGDNVKDPSAQAGLDFLSQRYKKMDKFKRFIRKEYDLLRLREVTRSDLEKMFRENEIDLEIAEKEKTWFKNIPRRGFFLYANVRRREFMRILRS